MVVWAVLALKTGLLPGQERAAKSRGRTLVVLRTDDERALRAKSPRAMCPLLPALVPNARAPEHPLKGPTTNKMAPTQTQTQELRLPRQGSAWRCLPLRVKAPTSKGHQRPRTPLCLPLLCMRKKGPMFAVEQRFPQVRGQTVPRPTSPQRRPQKLRMAARAGRWRTSGKVLEKHPLAECSLPRLRTGPKRGSRGPLQRSVSKVVRVARTRIRRHRHRYWHRHREHRQQRLLLGLRVRSKAEVVMIGVAAQRMLGRRRN